MLPSILIDVTVKSVVLVSLAAGGCAIARRSTAAHRHYLWALTLVGLLALPLLAAGLPWRLPVMPAIGFTSSRNDAAPVVPASAAIVAPDARTAGAVTAALRAPERMPANPAAGDQRAFAITPAAPATARLDFAALLGTLWLVGIALALGRLIIGVAALRWMMRGAQPISDRAWLDLLASTSERLDIRAPVRLLESPHANMPMAFGLRRPVVLLPLEADDWSHELREVVLLHELAHVRRFDVRANLVGQLACVLHWFNPLVWTAARRMRIEAERACDDLVLGAGAPASAYAAHLLEMVQAATNLRAPALAVPMAQPSAFEGRVLAILDPRVARHGLSRRAAVIGLLVIAAVTVPLAALAPVQDTPQQHDRIQRRVERRTQAAMQQAVTQAVRARVNAVTDVQLAQNIQAAVQESRVAERVAERAAREAARGQEDQARAHDPRVTVALMVALEDTHVDVRLEAIHALGERGDTAAINALVAALRRDASKEVRKTAAWALGQIEDARAVPGLLGALRDERDHEVRNQVVWALGQIESADAVAGLGAALRTEDDLETRRMMVWALGQIEDAAAVPFLVPLLRDSDAEVREKTVWALGQIESKDAVEPLVAMFASERTSAVRAQILWALGQLEDARAMPALEAALRDTSLEVRRKAVWAMGQIDNLRTAPAGLIAALHDPDQEIRRDAARAIGELQDPAAVPALVELMRDSDVEVRRNAVRALGEISSSASAAALVAALRDSDPEVRRLAAHALGDR